MFFSRLSYVLGATAALLQQSVATIGFSNYNVIYEGPSQDNTATITYNKPYIGSTLFLYISIVEGYDHSSIISQFKTLCENYAPNNISIIPRVRYGFPDNQSYTHEPEDLDTLWSDVELFAQTFAEAKSIINIPVIQAGFLGLWGEWHDGPYCMNQGTDSSELDLSVKKRVIETLLQVTGLKVATRYPRDHEALYNSNRTVTLHDDCIFDDGPDGDDGGTFPADNHTYWVDYAKSVGYNNTYGGEPCAMDGEYDWTNYTDVCGSNGLAKFLTTMGMAYINWENPTELYTMFTEHFTEEESCIYGIEDALLEFS